MYLVKWEGFEEKDATWEPLANLGNVKELIKDFEKDFICTDFSEPTELSTNLLQSQQQDSESWTLTQQIEVEKGIDDGRKTRSRR